MKRWAVVILRPNNFLDCVSVYGENKKEAKENADATIADHYFGAKIVKIVLYDKWVKNK